MYQVPSIKKFLILSLITCVFFSFQSPAKKTTVYVFLSETCPICQSYTLTLKELYSKYNTKNIQFVGVFPNYYSDLQSLNEFKTKYSIPFGLTLDADGKLTKHFKATITPEVFVESGDGKIIYSGRIDDSFYALGKRRTVISSTELADALQELTSKQTIKKPTTQAVGCIISASK